MSEFSNQRYHTRTYNTPPLVSDAYDRNHAPPSALSLAFSMRALVWRATHQTAGSAPPGVLAAARGLGGSGTGPTR